MASRIVKETLASFIANFVYIWAKYPVLEIVQTSRIFTTLIDHFQHYAEWLLLVPVYAH